MIAASQQDSRRVSIDLSPRDMLALRTGELIVASFFVAFLPLWKPLMWLTTTWLVNIGVYLYRKSPHFAHHSAAHRLRIIRWFSALDLISAASAGYLLHVPGNLAMQLLLQACLNVVATMWILERPRDSRLGGIGAAVIAMPAPLLVLLETGGMNLLAWLLVVGQMCFCVVLWLFAVKQEKSIDEQISLREQAEMAREQLAKANAAKLQFFAAASHDLRQPVHAIGLYLATLRSGQLDPRHATAIQGIHQSWSVLDGLLVQILDLARIGSRSLTANLAALDAQGLIADVVSSHFPIAEHKSIRLTVLAPRTAHLLADAFMLRRVVSNLLDNAIKFSPPGSTVVVALRQRHPMWALEVRDAGRGIAPDDQPRVFDEFVQVDNASRNRHEGFGLGLSVVKAFVQAMNGAMELRSAAGRGSTFRILLPMADAESHPRALAPAAPLSSALPDHPMSAALRASMKRQRQRILLIEDDHLVADAFGQLMDRIGVPFWHAVNAEQALGFESSRIAVAVCDLRLPGPMQGLDLALKFRQNGVASVVVSGEDDLTAQALGVGKILPVLRKPVHPQTFLETLFRLTSETAP